MVLKKATKKQFNLLPIEEGLNEKTRQRSSSWIGAQNPSRASCFVSVFLKKKNGRV